MSRNAYPAWMANELFRKQRQKEPDSYQAQEAAKYANMLRLRAERRAREVVSDSESDGPQTTDGVSR